MVNPPPHIDQILKGIGVEQKHTRHLPKDEAIKTALKIVLDHLKEDPKYYDKLKKAGLEEDKSIKCKNCGHKWKESEGGKDKYVCHKCQKNNKPKSGIKENLFSQGGGASDTSGKDSKGDSKDSSKPEGGEEKSTGSKIDSAGEFINQLNNIRTMLSNGKIKLDTKEIQLTSILLDGLINIANKKSAGPTFERLKKYLDNLTQS